MKLTAPRPLQKFSLSSKEYTESPYDFCRSFLEGYPAFYSEVDHCFVVSRFEDVKNMLSDYQTFSSSTGVLQKRVDRPDDYGFEPIFMMSPPAQTRLRKLSAPAFAAAPSQEITGSVVRDAQRLLETHATCPVIEVIDNYAMPLVVNAIVTLLQARGETAEQLAALITNVTMRCDYTQSEDTSFVHTDDVSLALKKLISGHQRALRASGGCGFPSRLMASDRAGDRLSDNEVFGMLYMSSMAGVEDAIRSIGNVLLALWQNKTAREIVCGDLNGRLDEAVLEALRLYPSSHFVRRSTTRDVVIDGVEIPAGMNVIALVAAANRDPAQFKDPDRFDLHRGNVKSAMTFGAGPHVCIGKHIGRAIVTVAVAEFLRAHPHYELDLSSARRTSRGMIIGFSKLVAMKGTPSEMPKDAFLDQARSEMASVTS